MYAPVAMLPSWPTSDQYAGKRQYNTGRCTVSSNETPICVEEVNSRVQTCARASRRGDWKENKSLGKGGVLESVTEIVTAVGTDSSWRWQWDGAMLSAFGGCDDTAACLHVHPPLVQSVLIHKMSFEYASVTKSMLHLYVAIISSIYVSSSFHDWHRPHFSGGGHFRLEALPQSPTCTPYIQTPSGKQSKFF